MSLSGLDSTAVEAAVRTISQERGAWFLVHYTSRDEVDVLAQGTKGVAELREAAEKYYNGDGADAEATTGNGPLFGMIDFRRRKVLIKLVPDDTSRLVKARVQVHWASVTTRFPNHESVFELTSTEQLTEQNVTAHIELHSGRSSAGSNKKPVLDGISEEGAEERISPLVSGKSSFVARAEDETQISPLSSADTTIDHSMRISALINKTNATSAALQESITNAPSSKDLSPVPEVSVTSTSPSFEPPSEWQQDRRPSTDSRSMLEMSSGRRLSTQSSRPSTATESLSLYELESLYKPKVKLGPRPATASRPASKSSNSAALPSGLRVSRPPSLRPKSRDSTYSAYRAPPPPPIPESSPLDFVQRPRSSGQSVKSLPATLPKSPGMTREKQRLMKFREMYKEKESKRAKNKVKAVDTEAAETVATSENTDVPSAVEKEEELPELTATISNPKDQFAQRLSVISEASTTMRSLDALAARSPKVDKDSPASSSGIFEAPISSKSMSRDGHSREDEDTSKASTAHQILDEPRTSSESSGHPAPSPTSLMDSSELTNSTRATSVTDDSDDEVSKEDADARRQTIVETPTHANDEDEDSQSSTPTAAPVTAEKRVSANGKEKRRAELAPITIPTDNHDLASETDGEHSLLGDDELMDELDGAEVQEAFSVSVTKSPITPFFSRRPSSAHTLNSPGSIILSDKTTPPPLPSPLPSSVERRASSSSAAAEAAVRAANLTRTMSGSMLKDQIASSSINEQQTSAESKQPGSKVESAEKRIVENEDHRATLTPEIWRTSAEPIEPEAVSPNSFSPRESSLSARAPARKPSTKKSRISSASRVLSSRNKSPSNSPNPSISRTSSGTMLSPTDDALSIHKRRNLGTGVAAKIADLQRNLSRGSPAVSPSAQPTSRKSSTVSVRASSILDVEDRTPPRSAHSHFRDEHLFRGRAMSKGSMRSFESKDTRTSTPPRNKSSGSVGRLDSRRFTNFNSPALEVSSKPDTIQVKATIIRADVDRSSDATGLGLQHTPVEGEQPRIISEPHYAQPRTSVIVEEPRSPVRSSMDMQMHRRARSSISSALGLIGIRSGSPQRTKENHPESPVVSDGRRSARTSLDMSGGLRALRRRASSSMSRSPSVTRGERSNSHQGRYSPNPLTPMTNGSAHSTPQFARTMSSSSLESSATTDYDGDSQKHKRKGSRASRMLKRMSNSMSSMLNSGSGGAENSGAHRQGNAVPTVEEEKWVGADLGEMNVQFPDTLLWKRRHLEVDTQGYLVLNPHDTSKARGSDKLERRYHLSQFFPPFAPDMERMEMPYSVVLDFREDGGTLQVAADTGLGQSGALRVLSEAHRVCSY